MSAGTKTYGRNACTALFEKRPDDVLRAWVTEDALAEMGEMLRALAGARKPYKVVEPEEMQRVAGAKHHEGVCLLAVDRPAPSLESLLRALPRGAPARLVYADAVGNPHNVGAILRVCAHFGAAALLGKRGEMPDVTGAVRRVAEGAAEHVPVIPLASEGALRAVSAAGFEIVATAARGEVSLYEPGALGARTVFLLGSERRGVSPALRALADRTVRIDGTGMVDSLNVATACAVLLAEHWRRHGTDR